ncbi:MAG: hypothetical protein JWQ02_2321 [Capsulimonas sp.]|nr:hypothetical protein [Capsulimonas sp.]
MPGRSHRDRLLFELADTRQELMAAVTPLKPGGLDWAPAEGMKTIRTILQEIGTMEKVTLHVAIHQVAPDWDEIWRAFATTTPNVTESLDKLTAARQETLRYLDGASEETLETPIPMPDGWEGYFGGAHIEPEELIRWIARHEYYHLGQIITYRWSQGDEPASTA